jgi:hypothetical protein
VNRFSSRKLRRRLALSAILAGVGGIILAAVLIGNTAAPEAPPSNHPVQLLRPPQRRPLTAPERREITSVARLFLRTAVSRHHPEQAWAVSSPALRAGQTLAQWRSGTLAVEPFPVTAAKWNLAYSDRNEVGLDVWVASDNLGAYPPQVFRLTFVRQIAHGQSKWLVDSWAPITMPGAVVTAMSPDAPLASANSPRASAKTSLIWVFVPFAVLIAGLIGVAGISLRTRVRERRITAAFRGRSA